MKKTLILGACAAALTMACAGVLAGCGSSGAAATVNGVDIPEQEVTDAIQSMREQRGLNSDKSWGEWLKEYNSTPESLRLSILEGLINDELLHQEAANLGIVVEDAEIDEYVEAMASRYETPEAWQGALDEVGMTQEEYRDNIESSLYRQRVEEQLDTDVEEPADPLTYAQSYLSTFDGVKRSSHILFAEGDEATAQQVLDQINGGQLDFAEAARTYSTDTGSAEQDGDVGWGEPINTFVDEYQDALDGLEVDQVSGLVKSQYGTHIIKCTEVFEAPDEIESLDELPTAFAEYASTQASKSDASTAYATWIEEKRKAANITINPMPGNVPYNVDMSKYMDEATLKEVQEQTEDQQKTFLGEEVAEDEAAEAADGAIEMAEDGTFTLGGEGDATEGGDDGAADAGTEGEAS